MPTDTTALIPQDIRTAMQNELEFYESIKGLKITNEQEYKLAADRIANLKKSIKVLEEQKKSITQEWADKKKFVDSEFKTVIDKLENGVTYFNKAMGAYFQEQRRIAAEKQAKLDAEAAEKRRKADEAARKELEKANQYRSEGRENMAQKAEARAETNIDIAANTVAPVVEVEKPKGTSYRVTYIAEVKDKKTAVSACFKNSLLEPAILIDVKVLEKIKKIQPGLTIDGIEFREVYNTVSRQG